MCFLRRGPDVFTTRGPSVFGPGAAAPRSKGARSDRSVYARRAVSLNDTRNGDGKNGRTDGRGRKTKKITTTIITNNINKIRSLFFFSRDEPVSLFVRAPRRKKSGRPASRVPSRRVSDGPRTSDAFCPRRICRRESSRPYSPDVLSDMDEFKTSCPKHYVILYAVDRRWAELFFLMTQYLLYLPTDRLSLPSQERNRNGL